MKKTISILLAALALSITATVNANGQHLAKQSGNVAHPLNNASMQHLRAKPKSVKPLSPTKSAAIKDGITRRVPIGRKVAGTASSVAMAPSQVTTSAPLYGVLLYSSNDLDYGVYEIGTVPSANTPIPVGSLDIYDLADDISMYGGAYKEGRYYANFMELYFGYIPVAKYHCIYDADTWQLIENIRYDYDSAEGLAADMAFNPIDGYLYGCYYRSVITNEGEEFQYYVGKQDPATFAVTNIVDIDGPVWDACGFDKNGTLYGIDKDGTLYSVDVTAGIITTIGNTGIKTYYTGGGTMDTHTGAFYWAVSPIDGKGYLYSVDIATAQATLVYQFSGDEEFTGMYIPTPDADDAAPDAVSNLTAAFDGPSLTGTLSFTMPSLRFDGNIFEPGTPMSYVVSLDDNVIASAATIAGASVSIDVTVPKPDIYRFVVYATNDHGAGPAQTVMLYVGTDTPKQPESASLTLDNDKLTLSWEPVTTGVNNGFIGDITYDITRYVNDIPTLVATDLTSTTYSEVFTPTQTELQSIYYTVVAKTADAVSAPTQSNKVNLGALVPPIDMTFQSEEAVSLYTIIDANHDGSTWHWMGGTMVAQFNNNNDMDDWVISPPVTLSSGSFYNLGVTIRAASYSYPERIEVLIGTAPTVEAMTTYVVKPTDLFKAEPTRLTGTITPEADGIYYIGFHGISDKNSYLMCLDSWSISAPLTTSSPAAVTDLTVSTSITDTSTAIVSFTAPSTDIGGMPTTLTKIEVYCDDTLCATIDSPAAGSAQSIAIPDLTDRVHMFRVVAYNSYGPGPEATTPAFVGINIPGMPTNATVVETENIGWVTISWEAPKVDKDGMPINPSFVRYEIVDNGGETIATDLTETSYTYQAAEDGIQRFVYYGIYASTINGESSAAVTNTAAVGTPYPMPVVESFVDGRLSYPMATDDQGGGSWRIANDSTFDDITDADGNNGYAYMVGSYINDSATLFTGKIAVEDNSVLGLHWYGLSETDNNRLDISVLCEGQLTTLKSIEQNIPGWNYEVISLADYAGRSIQVYLDATAISYSTVLVDGISVLHPVDHDLAVCSFSAPAMVKVNETFDITTKVMNYGTLTATDYTVDLYLDDNKIQSIPGVELSPAKSAQYTFSCALGISATKQNDYQVKINYAADEVPDNNVSIIYPVIIDRPDYPTVGDVAFVATADNAGTLTWAQPDLSKLPLQSVTDDFESYTPWSYSGVGDWLIVDADGSPMGGIQGVELPGLTSGLSSVAFFVFNNEAFSSYFAAYSGVQYMSTMYNSDASANDDWLISPQLSGQAQTISLYAKSYNTNYGYEQMELLYSTTDQQVFSFKMVSHINGISDQWEQYTFQVPEGARYFAIRCVSKDVFMLFVDDITYVPFNSQPAQLSIIGYNVYDGRDVKINDEPLSTPSFMLTDVKQGDTFSISVVYEQGESAAVSYTIHDLTGLADALASGVSIWVNDRTINVSGATDMVSICTPDGRIVYERTSDPHHVSVDKGIYIVKVGSTAAKVVVR